MKSIIASLIILGMVGCAYGSGLKLSELDNKYEYFGSTGPYYGDNTLENRSPEIVWISKKLLDQLLRAAIPEHETPIFRDEDGITYFNTDALTQKLRALELRIRALEFSSCGCSGD